MSSIREGILGRCICHHFPHNGIGNCVGSQPGHVANRSLQAAPCLRVGKQCPRTSGMPGFVHCHGKAVVNTRACQVKGLDRFVNHRRGGGVRLPGLQRTTLGCITQRYGASRLVSAARELPVWQGTRADRAKEPWGRRCPVEPALLAPSAGGDGGASHRLASSSGRGLRPVHECATSGADAASTGVA